MSHLHIPDGVISPIWWILGYVFTFLILALLLKKNEGG